MGGFKTLLPQDYDERAGRICRQVGGGCEYGRVRVPGRGDGVNLNVTDEANDLARTVLQTEPCDNVNKLVPFHLLTLPVPI